MIRAEVAGVDTANYIYDTGLTFGADLGHQVLELAMTKIDLFPKRHNYNRGDSPKELMKMIGADKARELYRRTAQMRALCGSELITFDQHFFPDALGQQLIESAPQWLQDLSVGDPSTMLQVSSNGNYLGTHKGHKRKASMFMLLQGGGQETRWYRNTEEFEVIDPLRIPDHDKIEHVVTAVMQHNFAAQSVRVNMGLDFNNVTAADIVRQLATQPALA